MQRIKRHEAEPAGLRMMSAIDAIQAMPGVLSAALIYHQFDELDVECKE
ncbi:chaperone NapD [Aeromonas salmonicida]